MQSTAFHFRFAGILLENARLLIARRRFSRVAKNILFPALPVLASLWFSALIALSDGYLAGKMNTRQLAAMGFCEPLWFLVALLTTGLCSGISYGLAQRNPKPVFFLADGLLLSAFCGSCLVGLALSLSKLLQMHPHWLSDTAPIVSHYFLFCALSNLPFALMQAQCAAFRANGNGRNVLLLWGTAALIEITLSNLFVRFGWASLAALAASWVIACLASCALGFVLLAPLMNTFNSRQYFKSNCHERMANINLILRIGCPIALGELGLICGSFLNLQIISTLPDAHVFEAAWAIKSRLEEAIEIVPICAIGLTVAPFMSRHCNGHSLRRAKWAKLISFDAAVCAGILLISALLFMQLAARGIVGLFACDLNLVEQATAVISIASLAWPFFAVSQVFVSSMEGAGQTLAPTLLTLICTLPVRLGLAFVLKDCQQYEAIVGITIAGVIAQLILSLSIIWLYRRLTQAT